MKKIIAKAPLPVQGTHDSTGSKRASSKILSAILCTSQADVEYLWEAEVLKSLVDKLIDWWKKDKQLLQNELAEQHPSYIPIVDNELRNRLAYLPVILAEVVAPNVSLLDADRRDALIAIVLELAAHALAHLEVQVAFAINGGPPAEDLQEEVLRGLYSRDEDIVADALKGILLYVRSGSSDSSGLLSELFNAFKTLRPTGLVELIYSLTRIVEEHSSVLTQQNHLTCVDIGLSNLLEEVRIKNNDSALEVDEKLRLKQTASHLCVALKQYFTANNTTSPTYITEWEKDCTSPDEFADIRRIWEEEQ